MKKYCLNCGKEISARNHLYCNNQCQVDYQYKQWIERWKKGEENGVIGQYGTSKHIRRYLGEKYHEKCARCGWGEVNPYTHKVPLEIEHIDGNYLNNKEDNLTLLCPNCHSLTSTYKGANKGHGRKERKKYSLYENPELGEKSSSVETLHGTPTSEEDTEKRKSGLQCESDVVENQ